MESDVFGGAALTLTLTLALTGVGGDAGATTGAVIVGGAEETGSTVLISEDATTSAAESAPTSTLVLDTFPFDLI